MSEKCCKSDMKLHYWLKSDLTLGNNVTAAFHASICTIETQKSNIPAFKKDPLEYFSSIHPSGCVKNRSGTMRRCRRARADQKPDQ